MSYGQRHLPSDGAGIADAAALPASRLMQDDISMLQNDDSLIRLADKPWPPSARFTPFGDAGRICRAESRLLPRTCHNLLRSIAASHGDGIWAISVFRGQDVLMHGFCCLAGRLHGTACHKKIKQKQLIGSSQTQCLQRT